MRVHDEVGSDGDEGGIVFVVVDEKKEACVRGKTNDVMRWWMRAVLEGWCQGRYHGESSIVSRREDGHG